MPFGHGRKLYELMQESWSLQLRHPWEEKPIEEMQLYTTVAHKFVTYLCQTEWDHIGHTEHTLKNKAYLKRVEGEDWGTKEEYAFGKRVWQIVQYPGDPKSADLIWTRIGKETQLRYIAIGKDILAHLEEEQPLWVLRGEHGPEKVEDVLDSLEERVQKVVLGQDSNQERLARLEAYITRDRKHLEEQIATLNRVVSQLA